MRKYHFVPFFTLCTTLSIAAIAKENPITQLPRVKVIAGKTSLTSKNVHDAEEKLKTIPGGTAVIDKKTFENTYAATIKDMLDYTPGVLAQPRFAEEMRLSIRGSGLSRTFHLRGITLLQDGIPINLTDGSADFQEIDPTAFQHIEVYKGANALQYGTASLGGAINFVTPTGYDTPRIAGRLEGGSFGTLREHISSGQTIGNTDYYASASHLRTDGYRDFAQQNNTRFFSNIGHKITPQVETRFYISYGDINQELPGNLTKAQLEANPKQANATNYAMDQQRDFSIYRIANKTTWHSDAIEINGGLYTLQKDLYHPIFQLVDQQNSDYGVYANTLISGMVAGKRNELTLGTHLATGYTDAKQYTNLAGNYGAPTHISLQQSRNAAIYLENRFFMQDYLSLIAGSQFTYAHRNYKDKFLSDGDRSGEKTYRGASPKVGVLYDVTPSIQLFSNISRAYEPPTFSELTQNIPGVSGLANIDAQQSTTLEIGSRGHQGRIDWDASLYRSWLKDELMAYSLGGTTSGVLNADNTIHQGIELGLTSKLAGHLLTHEDTLSFRIAYTYNDFYFEKDPQWNNNQIPGAPKHYIRSELRYGHPSGFYIAPNVENVPEHYPVDMANTLYTDPYLLYGLQTGYKLNGHVTFFVDGRNLADKKYIATTGVITSPTTSNRSQFIPGDGRTIYTGLSFKW